jgi:group I intron endonuclease
MVSSVYSVRRRETGEEYVGVTSQPVEYRWRQHVTLAARKPKGRLQREIRRVGEDAFDLELRAELPTYEEAQIAERILIALEQPALNALLGGQGRLGISAPKHTVESKAKISAAHTGKTLSAKTRAKISSAKAGKPGPKPSDETRVKLSAAQTGNTKMLGKKQSPETRAKISAAMQGNTNRRNAVKI